MSFIEKLKINFEEKHNFNSIWDNKYPSGLRMIEWLPIGDGYSLSIQASVSAYCKPRALVPLDQYTEFEMALIYIDKLSTDVEIFKGFDRYEELLKYQEGTIFPFTPKDLIEDLYNWRTKKGVLSVEEVYILYIKENGEFRLYGTGVMCYIRELLYDYLVKHDMYGAKSIEFKVERF